MRLYELFKRDPEDKGRPGVHEPWRGPHEGRKLELMLTGKKPAAWLYDEDFDIDEFLPYIKDGTFSAKEFDYGDKYPNLRGYVVTLPGEEWRANKLQKLFNDSEKYFKADKEALWHARVGLLLGYSNEQIRRFITSN